jgi:hypothetical protein
MATRPQPYRFRVEDYDRMISVGVFGEDDRLELIEGAIVEMAPIGPAHAWCVKRLTRLFSERVAERAVVSVQDPVRLGELSEPQPDLALLRPEAEGRPENHPGPGDVLLVVEVADTTAEADRTVKIPLYARAGIREAWLVDLAAGRVEVYRDPTPEGYREVRTAAPGEALTPETLPDVGIPVGEVLGGPPGPPSG